MKAKSPEPPKPLVRKPPFWYVLASIAVLSLAFPPVEWCFLVFVGLAPLLAYLRDCNTKQALKAGYFFGFFYFGYQMLWVAEFVGRWLNSLALGFLPWFICAFLAGFFYMLTAWLVHLCYKIRKPWLAPLVWAGIEGLRAYFPVLAFPWAFVAHPLWRFPWLVQHAAFGTVLLVSTWVVLINLILAETVLKPKESHRHVPTEHLFRYGIAVAGLFFLGALRMSFRPETVEKTVTAAQPGVNFAFNTPDNQMLENGRVTPGLIRDAIGHDSSLVAFPEGYAGSVYGPVPETPLGPNPPVPVVFGGQRFADGTSYETAFAWDGTKWQTADKTRLVIMGEYVPFRDQLPFLKDFKVAAYDISPGKTLTTIPVNDIKIGPLICFEGIFPDLAERHSRQGAQLLVQMSIDDWYESTPAYTQLWESTVWRSIESGLPILRVGARGQSLITDDRGEVVAMAPVGQPVALNAKIGIPKNGADGLPYRTAFLPLTWAVCVFVPLELVRLRRKLKSKASP